jgi:hypothetical protein
MTPDYAAFQRLHAALYPDGICTDREVASTAIEMLLANFLAGTHQPAERYDALETFYDHMLEWLDANQDALPEWRSLS